MRSLSLFFKEVRFIQYRENRLSRRFGKFTIISKSGVIGCNDGQDVHANAARARQVLP